MLLQFLSDGGQHLWVYLKIQQLRVLPDDLLAGQAQHIKQSIIYIMDRKISEIDQCNPNRTLIEGLREPLFHLDEGGFKLLVFHFRRHCFERSEEHTSEL